MAYCEVVTGMNEVMTVVAGNGCFVVLICDVIYGDGVPDVEVTGRYVQGEWCCPRDVDVVFAMASNVEILNCC